MVFRQQALLDIFPLRSAEPSEAGLKGITLKGGIPAHSRCGPKIFIRNNTSWETTMQNPWKVKMAMARKKFLFHLGWMIDFKIAVENIPKHPWPRWTANSTRLLHELWTQSSHQKLALECSQHQSTIRFFGRGFDQFLRFGTTPEQETQVQGDIQY